MATEKVGVYRKYHGPVPMDSSGRAVPPEKWQDKRPFRWAVRWFGSDGRRYSKSFRTRKEADRFAEKRQSDVREGRGDPPPEVLLREFAKEHKQVMQGQVARETLEDQNRALKMFMKHVGEDKPLRCIQPRHAESYVAVRMRSGVKIATVNKDIRTLKRVFSLAITPRGYLLPGHNPFVGIKQRKESRKPIRYVSPAEFQAILAAAGTTWWEALLALAYTTAARLGELMNLTWGDVDFAENRIRVACKEGGEALTSWEPKDHEGRILPVPEPVMDRVTQLQLDAPDGCPYVFVPAWRWEYITRARREGQWKDERDLVNNLNRRLATLRRRARVAKFTYHDLRRSCITNWARQLPMHVVQKLAGHSDIKTTQKYYLSVQADDLAQARTVAALTLKAEPTDPKLTHSGQNGPSAAPKQKEPST